MFEIKHLAIGDKITLIYHDRTYSSVAQDIPTPDTVVIAQPTSRGIYLNMVEGGEAELLFRKQNGMLTFQAVLEARLATNIPMLRLRAISAVKRSQRRNYFRLEKSLPVQLSVKGEEDESKGLIIKARTINISGGGCRIALRQPLEYDTRLECKITLTPGTDLVMDGQVVWVERQAGDDRTMIIGVQFDEDNPTAQKALVSFVTSEQRKQLKAGK